MSELELKFRIPPGGREGLLEAVGRRELERVELDARYFDTGEHLLARHRMALRLRRENGRWVQTLKAARLHSVERAEHEVELPAGMDAGAGLPDPARHEGTEVGAQLAGLLARAGHPPLLETYRAEVVRLRRLLTLGEAEVEWSLDQGRIVAGEREHAVDELELELKDGGAPALYAMARDWQTRHGLWLDVVSKAHRGTLLAGGLSFAEPVRAERARLAPGMGVDAMRRAVVAACLAQVLPNVGELACGSTAAAHVHQARIGLRRLRAALRGREPFASGLGAAGALEPVCEALRRARAAAAPPSPQLLRAPAFQSALLALLAYSQGEPGEERVRA